MGVNIYVPKDLFLDKLNSEKSKKIIEDNVTLQKELKNYIRETTQKHNDSYYSIFKFKKKRETLWRDILKSEDYKTRKNKKLALKFEILNKFVHVFSLLPGMIEELLEISKNGFLLDPFPIGDDILKEYIKNEKLVIPKFSSILSFIENNFEWFEDCHSVSLRDIRLTGKVYGVVTRFYRTGIFTREEK